jgi:hypothetical protein
LARIDRFVVYPALVMLRAVLSGCSAVRGRDGIFLVLATYLVGKQ